MFCVGVRHHHLAAIKDQQRVCCFNLNAAVVGFLLAALYDPVWTSAILSPSDFGLAIGAYALLVFWKVPP
jgi:chromate transporter